MRNPLLILSILGLSFVNALESEKFDSIALRKAIVPNKHSDFPIHLDLKEPVYKNGILETKKGGIVTGKNFRLQAEQIQYIHKKIEGVLVHQIKAKGNILLQYQKRAFIGETLTFDLNAKEGVLENGATLSAPWYVTSKKINIYSDKRYNASDATLTACERKDSTWDICAKEICVDDCKLETSGVKINLFKTIPIRLPSFKANLGKKDKRPIFKYQVKFDRNRPKVSFRYQAYSWEDLFVYLRGEYRLPKKFWKNPNWQKGFGGAVETDYLSFDKRKKFLTRSYVGYDVLIDDSDPETLYRLQGEGCYSSEDGTTVSEWTWDKYSDRKMPGNFKSSDFEVNSRLRSELTFSSQKEMGTFYFYLHPRLNSFETINQELPSGTIRIYPLSSHGITSDNYVKTSYHDLKFADAIDHELKGYDSGRFQTYHNVYRPFNFDAFTFTPNIGATGVLYSDSPSDHAKGLGIFFTGMYAKANYYKCFSNTKHLIEPYLQYKYVAATTDPDSRYIFSIEDGITDLSQLTVGLKNFVLSKSTCHSWIIDLYSHLFFEQDRINTLPKAYLDISWSLPSLEVLLYSAWDIQHQILDYTNILTRYTVSDDLAFSLEGRYRSEYRWRKADYNSFFLDVTRKESDLLLSPLSDRRFTILTNIFYRINYLVSLHLQSHHGFLRENQSPYNEFNINLIASLSRYWKLTLSFRHQEGGNQYGFTFKLIK